jgi:hypothetical protein
MMKADSLVRLPSGLSSGGSPPECVLVLVQDGRSHNPSFLGWQCPVLSWPTCLLFSLLLGIEFPFKYRPRLHMLARPSVGSLLPSHPSSTAFSFLAIQHVLESTAVHLTTFSGFSCFSSFLGSHELPIVRQTPAGPIRWRYWPPYIGTSTELKFSAIYIRVPCHQPVMVEPVS